MELSPDFVRWQHLKALLAEAADLAPDARTALLAGLDDADLRADLADLLAAHDEAETLDRFEAPAFGAPHAFAEDARVGPYRLVREIGRGGMGTVYRAERADGQFEQAVALKLLPPGLGSASSAERFRTERQILARLEHPHVARLLDGGVTKAGPLGHELPWLAMELVDGESITAYAERRRLPVEARVRLFLQVCDAVAYAHRSLVVHRDLKPSNILVAETDQGTPSVKLLDFGIAKLIEEESAGGLRTQTGVRPMTPEYAAPEQIRGEPISTATDVYALGVVLYELLAGRRPYDLAGQSPSEIERTVCDTPPTKPSSTVRPATYGDGAEPVAPRLRGDLDTIVLKALAKEPGARYAGADALADDLQRHLSGLPVHARPATAGYRTRKFVARHRMGAAAAVLVLLALLVGLGAALWQGRIAAAERDSARLEAAKADQVNLFLQSMLASADPYRAETDVRSESLTVAQVLRRASVSLDTALADQPEVRAAVHRTLAQTFSSLGLYPEATPHFRAALALRDSLYPGAHPDRIESLDDLARFVARTASAAEADSLQTVALGLRREQFGERSLDYAASLARLAFTQPLDRSEPLYREATAIVTDLRGPRSVEVGTLLLSHATNRLTNGDCLGADSLFAQAAALGEAFGRSDHLDFAILLTNWSSAATYLGHYDQAEQLLQRSLALQEPRLPDDNPFLAETRSNYAVVLIERGRYREAEALLRGTIPVFETQIPEWWARYAARAELGAALAGQGRDAEAEPLLRENVDAMRRDAGDAHGATRHLARHLVAFYDSRGRPADADPYRALVGY